MRNRNMDGKIKIDCQRCKGCGLCVVQCPKGCIQAGDKSNSTGYFYIQVVKEGCTGCAMCAVVCPEAAITVYRDDGKSEKK